MNPFKRKTHRYICAHSFACIVCAEHFWRGPAIITLMWRVGLLQWKRWNRWNLLENKSCSLINGDAFITSASMFLLNHKRIRIRPFLAPTAAHTCALCALITTRESAINLTQFPVYFKWKIHRFRFQIYNLHRVTAIHARTIQFSSVEIHW